MNDHPHNEGDIVAADVRLIEANELKVNEMLLTGEPDDVAKTFKCQLRLEKDVDYSKETLPAPGATLDRLSTIAVNQGEEKLTPATMAFTACLVTNGKGIGIVTDIGMQTRVLGRKRADKNISSMLGGDASICFYPRCGRHRLDVGWVIHLFLSQVWAPSPRCWVGTRPKPKPVVVCRTPRRRKPLYKPLSKSWA